ncbi:Protein of unknown function [Gryllus bimaculatus]|nr:Protein of unknown function [Gryllus bimaculatus]
MFVLLNNLQLMSFGFINFSNCNDLEVLKSSETCNSKLIFFVFLHYRNKRVIKCYNLLCWKEAGRWWRLQKDFPFA